MKTINSFILCVLLSVFNAVSSQTIAQLNTNSMSQSEYEANRDELLKKGKVVPLKVVGGDSMAYVQLNSCRIESAPIFESKKALRRYRTLERRVRKVYPYAQEAGKRLKLYNDTLSTMKIELVRKAYMKKTEKEIKKEFFNDLKNLTMSEGKILIRLIDRQTGDTSYELLRELRGTMSAAFWQTLAKVWGNDLKKGFDASTGEDKIIEQIINNIENGAYN